MSKQFRILSAGLVLVIFTLASATQPEPGQRDGISLKYNGTLVMQGLSDSVTVFYDERGMPHIYARNEHDLYRVTGFLTARERLWQMDLLRRSTTGRLSEIFGASFLQADVFARCLQIREKAARIIANEDPCILECMNAYSAGINDYISSCGKHFPPEFRLLSYRPEPWCLEDIASIIGLLGWNLDCRNLTAELFVYQLTQKVGPSRAAELIPDWQAAEEVVYKGFEIHDSVIAGIESMVSTMRLLADLGLSASSSSNNWAVSGARSMTGMPLLSNDMHLNLSSPGIWMQMHQVVPGALNVTGVLIPGEPFIIAGHNSAIAWGMTNFRVDAIDLYAEKMHPDSSGLYLCNGRWHKITEVQEVFRIRGGHSDTITLRFSHRGPIISGCMNPGNLSPKMKWLGYDYLISLRNFEKSALSMRWSGFDDSDEVNAVWLLNRAEGWNDFRKGISNFRSVSQNVIYADTLGNIGMSSGGGIPVRNGNAIIIRNGETEDCDWKGYVPFEQMPFIYNPGSGYVSSANNRTVDNEYPWFITNSYELPYRINRINEMIEAKEKFDVDDFCRMLTDQHSDLARLMTPLILRMKDTPLQLPPVALAMLDTLSSWDYEMSPLLIAPTLLEYFRISFKRNLLADELGDLFDRMWNISAEYYVYRIMKEGPDRWVDDITTEAVETLDDIVRKSFLEAISAIEKEHGKKPEHWKWGRIHTVTFTHPLGSVRILDPLLHFNSRKYPVGGSDHTVCPYFTYKPGFDAENGASVRHIFSTANWDESFSVIPGGMSGIPGSEFYLSQADAFISGRFYRDHFSRDAVVSSAKYTLIIKPAR